MSKNAILITVAFLVTMTSLAQKDEVFSELEASFSFAKHSESYAFDASNYINACYSADHIDDIQYYAGKARKEIDDAKSEAGFALTDASAAKFDSDEVDCFDVEDEANNAESYFYSAQSKFEDTFTYLSSAQYSDDMDDIAYYLRQAKAAIEYGLADISHGLSALNSAFDELNDCN